MTTPALTDDQRREAECLSVECENADTRMRRMCELVRLRGLFASCRKNYRWLPRRVRSLFDSIPPDTETFDWIKSTTDQNEGDLFT